MSWPLREIPFPLSKSHADLEPGECFRVPLSYPLGDETYAYHWEFVLSPEFMASGRDFVWQIALPGGGVWSPDFKESGGEAGWTVRGVESPETLTAQPSINAGGSYHGWLTNGVLTDDCEGRTY